MPTLPFAISPLVLGLALGASLLIAGCFGVAFIYHWRAYGMNTRPIRLAAPVYLAVSGILAASAIVSYLVLAGV